MAIITPKVKEILTEASASLIRIDAEKDQLKEINKKLQEEMGIKGNLASKIIRTWYKGNYSAEAAEFDEFSTIMENLSTGNFTSPELE